MRNDERFIVAFNKIEKFFDQQLNDSRYVPFYRAVQRLRKTNAVINRYHNDLLEFSELRNAIVHERTDHHYTIADPHDDIVDSIEKIANELTAPKSVMKLFAKTLRTVQADLSVKEVLTIIKETEFSQFPVYRSKQFLGLLTDKAILHWIAHHMNGDVEVLLGTKVIKLIDDDAIYDTNYRFIEREMSIYQAEDIFINAIKKHKRLDALLITETGEPHERLLGMITPNDLIHIP